MSRYAAPKDEATKACAKLAGLVEKYTLQTVIDEGIITDSTIRKMLTGMGETGEYIAPQTCRRVDALERSLSRLDTPSAPPAEAEHTPVRIDVSMLDPEAVYRAIDEVTAPPADPIRLLRSFYQNLADIEVRLADEYDGLDRAMGLMPKVLYKPTFACYAEVQKALGALKAAREQIEI